MRVVRGSLYVVCGPSGAGKTSIIKGALEKLQNVVFSVSCTTRPKRPGEVDGRDYFFISEEEFLNRVKNGEFLEWAKVHGHLYGTLKSFVEEHLSAGEDVLLDIDVQGAISLKRKGVEAVFIYVAPPSYEELKSRIAKRGTEKEADVIVRLENAKWELMFMDEFDYLIVNSDLTRSIDLLVSIVEAERTRVNRNRAFIDELVMEVKGWKRS